LVQNFAGSDYSYKSCAMIQLNGRNMMITFSAIICDVRVVVSHK